MSKNSFVRQSLTQHFTPAPGFVGEFGWICGYSADASFMDLAAERFTGQIAARRRAAGCVRLGLLLDPGNRQVSMAEAPGVMHFPVRSTDLPFRLLHAKVAILGYRKLDEPQRFQLRLLVSTGNWTRATLEDNLDLIWRIDIDSDDLGTADSECAQQCADLTAAWDLMTWLQDCFDLRLLSATPAQRSDTETMLAHQRLARWIALAGRHAGSRTRFIDNRGQSLLANVRRKLRGAGNAVARNYLAMGSGYYEGGDMGRLPTVPQAILEGLQEDGRLTQSNTVDLYANASACQAIASGLNAIVNEGWTVRPPASMQYGSRFMHAKFLFSAWHKETSNRCGSAWIYLGSGNLTIPGFLKKASTNGGNLEAGIVQALTDVYWYEKDGAAPEQVISNLLPIRWDAEFNSPSALSHGDEMAEREPDFVALPLTFVVWEPVQGGGWLRAQSVAELAYEIRDPDGLACQRHPDSKVRWEGARPQQVLIAWTLAGREHRAWIPVIDEYGRVGAGALSGLDLEQAGLELEGFPLSPEDDNGDGDGEGGVTHRGGVPPTRSLDGTKEYPIRSMMKLLEQIADKQCAVTYEDWSMWCHRLEQVLVRTADSKALAAFRELGMNPLSALYVPAFRPPYAETGATEEGGRYEQALRRIEQAWGVTDMMPLGAA